MESWALTAVPDSTVLIFPHQWADAYRDTWQSCAHGREELLGLLPRLLHRIPHNSALRHMEAFSECRRHLYHLGIQLLRHLEWCPRDQQ